MAEGCEHPNADNPLMAWAKDGLFFCDTYSVTRVSWSCRELQPLTSVVDVWKPRLQQLCSFWALPYKEEQWREQYLGLFRPRWDGIYVGCCQYLHKVRPGASMTQKGSSVWITYRRYLRFFPPDDYGTLRALVLQDPAPLEVALQSLLATPAPVAGDGFGKGGYGHGEGLTVAKHTKEAKHHLEKKIFTAQYTYREGFVDLNYTCDLGDCHVRLRVDHTQPGNFSEQMAWVDSRTAQSEGFERLAHCMQRVDFEHRYHQRPRKSSPASESRSSLFSVGLFPEPQSVKRQRHSISRQNKEGAMVTVEVRARDTVRELKSKAYHQLSVWNRFTDFDAEASSELPPLGSCRLGRRDGGDIKLLDDRKRLRHCGLVDGEELQLMVVPQPPASQAAAQTPQPQGGCADAPEEATETLPTVRLNVLVAHALGEVNIEAWSSETVLAVKKRAHAQLEVWCRFADACSEEGATSSLPGLAQSRLHAAGSGDGTLLPHPLDERASLARCGLQDGAKLFLRAT
ncbi:unnamed protein product [Symbiodinium natans]|uniref:Ubiquitin-like domain-containing protein n=1 Tax=Symbiodinium natans TaxID=878477 RepID=A0A812QMH3_9DINO|nr:unnamed protein product [Symbiodinium natans]